MTRAKFTPAKLARIAVCLAAAALLVSVGANLATYASSIHSTRGLQEAVKQNRKRINENAHAVSLLCDNDSILIDLTDGAITVVQADLASRTNKVVRAADRAFISLYKRDRERLRRQLTDPSSPCAGHILSYPTGVTAGSWPRIGRAYSRLRRNRLSVG